MRLVTTRRLLGRGLHPVHFTDADSDMGHRGARAGAVPMLLARCRDHSVTGRHLSYRIAPRSDSSASLRDMQHLPPAVSMPVGGDTWVEGNGQNADLLRLRHLVDDLGSDFAGEPHAVADGRYYAKPGPGQRSRRTQAAEHGS
jgi:hypothetical protein